MKRKLLPIVLSFFVFGLTFSFGQQLRNETQKVSAVGKAKSVRYVKSLAKQSQLVKSDLSEKKVMQDRRSWRYDVIAGKGSEGDDVLAKNQHILKNAVQSQGLNLNFESGDSNSQPTDPSGAVGPNHYFAVINTAFEIYDKSGVSLTGSLSPDNIFTTGSCCDLTISYDNLADRWIMSILYSSSGAEVAISDGPDPVNDGWYVYAISQISDYQKLSVWSDGYYITENTASNSKLHVLERDRMLMGDINAKVLSFQLPGIETNGFHAPQALNITDNNFPDVGSAPIVYMADDSWNGVTQDHLKIWTTDMDWDNPSNSTVSAAQEIATAPFLAVFDNGDFENLDQPGGSNALVDALQATIMNQAQWRWFPTHRSAVFNFVVDADGGLGELAAIRWYELRQNGNGLPWYIYQEGTYTAPDGKHAWNASLAMDSEGNIGMGYTGMGGPTTPGTVYVGSYYTGRMAGDPLGTMTIAETVIKAGNADIPTPSPGNPAGARYGDYSKIDVDPVNDKEFWFNNELMFLGRKNWVGVFQIASDNTNDVGVVAINNPGLESLANANQTIGVTLYNYGTASASNFDVSYQIDGGSIITETYTGTITAGSYANFNFATTANMGSAIQTYQVFSETNMIGDQDTGNDFTNSYAKKIYSDDLGVIEIISPISSEALSNETISIKIKNFGLNSQSNFDVAYILDGDSPVIENVPVTLLSGETITYNFVQTGDFSTLGDHNLATTTSLGGDADSSNDEIATVVTNLTCTSESNATSQPVGPDSGTVTTSIITFTDNFVVSDVNVTLNLDHTYDGDLEIKLIAPNAGGEVLLYSPSSEDGANFANTIFDDEGASFIYNGTPPYVGTFIPIGSLSDFDGLQSAGDWSLQITDTANLDGGTLNSWSLQLCENPSLSLDEKLLNGNMTIIHRGNSQYLIKLSTNSISERLDIEVINTLGQRIYWRNLDNESGNGYTHNLDMSYVSAGLYFVRIGNNQAGVTKRIIVNN